MNYDSEIRNLAGETLALQRFLASLCSRLVKMDPAFDKLIRAAFDETADFLEHRTIKLGKAVPPEHLAHSLRVIEEIRTATLGNKGKPQHGV